MGAGLWAQAALEEPFVLQPGRGQVFVTIPFQATRIGLLRGGCRVALEAFTAAGATKKVQSLAWDGRCVQISSTSFEMLKERMN